MEFQVGAEVETMIEDPGFENSYYEATIVSNEGSSGYKVVYKDLLKADGSGPLEEIVRRDQLRPLPPHVPVSCFSLYELADVKEDDGWWAGIIYGKFRSVYYFLHPQTREEKPYPIERLRVHHDWEDGRWICKKAGINQGSGNN